MKKFILIILIAGSTLRADTDAFAHFGVAGVAQFYGYGFARKALRLNRTEAFIFSAFTVAMGGLVWEYAGRTQVSGRDLLMNTAGQATAAITIYQFDF